MSIVRLLGPQGLVGLAAALALGAMLLVQKIETRHWRKRSGQFEQLYRAEQSAFARTVSAYRAAAEAARAADRAAAERVRAEQHAINERTVHDYEARLADARARARRLQLTAPTDSDSCHGRAAPMPGLPAAACGADQGAGQNGLPASDALLATEQALQLDALIGWVRNQAAIDPNAPR